MRLDFQLPEFLRVIWSSPEARAVWERRISRISSAWLQMERLAVVANIKPAALQTCSPEEFPTLVQWALEHDLICVPLSQQGVSDGYANGTRAYEPGRSWAYRIVITNPDLAKLFVEAWKEESNERIGAALGFPKCCRDFFQQFWVELGWRDLTLPMTPLLERADGHHRVGGPIECNILLRWLGLRLVSHLPCSFHCDATEAIGQRMGLLGLRLGYVEEMDWLTQMLNWPIRYSTLHGVGIVTTPIFRLVFDSTAISDEVKVDRDGPIYPDEAARGNDFPFKNQERALLIRDDYTDNGFKNKETMDAAHKLVISWLPEGVASVLDLGCGNGLLLDKISRIYPDAKISGVENDFDRHQRAARKLIKKDPDIRLGTLYNFELWSAKYDVILISEQRLDEALNKVELLLKLYERGKIVLIYNYSTMTVRTDEHHPL